MDDEKTPAAEMRDALVKLLRDTDGYEDVAPIDEVSGPQVGFYNEEVGHEFFITVEPA